jgi:formate dehydrogenase subunit gamma
MLAALIIFISFAAWSNRCGRSGRKVVRFNDSSARHWMTATCSYSGAQRAEHHLRPPLVILPTGLEAFSDWSQWAKYAHNYLSFPSPSAWW